VGIWRGVSGEALDVLAEDAISLAINALGSARLRLIVLDNLYILYIGSPELTCPGDFLGKPIETTG
jgi:hypothetical protein